MRLPRPSTVRAAAVISGAAWVWSWYTMYLEIHRWEHVTRSFRFNPGPLIPGTNIRPRPGLPLKFLFVCSAAAPIVFVGNVITGIAHAHVAKVGQARGQCPERFDRIHDRLLDIKWLVLEPFSLFVSASSGFGHQATPVAAATRPHLIGSTIVATFEGA